MALLAPQTAKITGTALSYAAATAGGDTLSPSGRACLHVRNGSAGAITVTVVTPGNTRYGQADPDIPVAVPAAGEVAIGPFPPELGDPATGLISVDYSAAASVTVALVSV
jgi:hypothetical protein